MPTILVKQLADLFIIPLFVFSFIVFMLPGLLGASFLKKKNLIDAKYSLLIACGVMSMVSYLLFWVFYINNTVGKGFSILLTVFSITILLWPKLRTSVKELFYEQDIKIPSILMLLFGMLYVAITFSIMLDEMNLRFAIPKTAADYKIPMWAGHLLYNGENLWMHIVCKYKTTFADRAPLLPGIYLTHYFLIDEIFSGRMISRYYTAISLLAQLFWVPAVWALCRFSGHNIRRTVLLVMLCSLTGFFFFHSIFSWPKMLAGSLITGTFILLVLIPWLEKRKPSGRDCIMGALFAGLGFLGHGASGLMLLPISCFLLKRKYFPGFKSSLAGLLVFLILVVPWMILKNRNESQIPGLIRFALVNHFDKRIYEDKTLSIPKAIYATYSQMTAEVLMERKKQALGRILFSDFRDLITPYYKMFGHDSLMSKYRSMTVILRDYDVRYLLRSLGILIVGLFLFLPWFRSRGLVDFKEARKVSVFFIIFSLFAFAIPFVLFYRFLGYHYTSFTATILFYVALLMMILNFSRRLFFAVFAIQLIYFVIIWVFALPGNDFMINPFMVCLAISFAVLIGLFVRHALRSNPC